MLKMFPTNFQNYIKVLNVSGNIWNHHDKRIQISTNMTIIGSIIREIAFENVSIVWYNQIAA